MNRTMYYRKTKRKILSIIYRANVVFGVKGIRLIANIGSARNIEIKTAKHVLLTFCRCVSGQPWNGTAIRSSFTYFRDKNLLLIFIHVAIRPQSLITIITFCFPD